MYTSKLYPHFTERINITCNFLPLQRLAIFLPFVIPIMHVDSEKVMAHDIPAVL